MKPFSFFLHDFFFHDDGDTLLLLWTFSKKKKLCLVCQGFLNETIGTCYNRRDREREVGLFEKNHSFIHSSANKLIHFVQIYSVTFIHSSTQKISTRKKKTNNITT